MSGANSSPSTPAVSEENERRFGPELTRQSFLYTIDLLIPSTYVTLAVATLVGLQARPYCDEPVWTIWFILTWMGGLTRIFLVRSFRRSPKAQLDYRAWHKKLVALQFAAGAFMGSLILLPREPLDRGFLTVFLIVVGSFSTSATATYVGVPRVFAVSVVNLLLPSLWRLGMTPGLDFRLLAALVTLHGIAVFATYSNASRSFRQAMLLRFQNLDLAERLAARSATANQALANAEEAVRERIRFLAAASHDLRQPVHALGLFVAALRDAPEPQRPSLLGRLELSLAGLQLQLDRLLDVSQLDAASVHLRKRTFSLSMLEEGLSAMFGLQAQERGLRLTLRFGAGEFYTDPNLVFQILQNLVANALRYTRTGGVLVATRRRGAKVLFQVWDTGVGISDSDLPKIFGLFERGEVDHEVRDRGVGLGLAIVARLAELLGGSVHVRSRLGKGSVFELELPRLPEQAVPSLPVSLSDKRERFKGNVLIVDDDLLAREGLASVVQAWGYRALAVPSVDGAVQQFKTHPNIGALVTDYHLAHGARATDVLTALATHLDKPLPTLVLTGAQDLGAVRAQLPPEVNLAAKPIRPESIQAFLEAAFASQASAS